MVSWAFPGDASFVAETAGGDFAGYAAAVIPQGGSDMKVCAVEVPGEYRGLGLGKSLVARLVEHADSQKIRRVIIELPAAQEYFSRVLSRESFNICIRRFVRELPE